MRHNHARVARPDDERAVKREVCFDDHTRRGARANSAVTLHRPIGCLGYVPAAGEDSRCLHFERRPQLVDLRKVIRGQRAHEDSAVARLDEEPSPDEAIESRAQRVAPHGALSPQRGPHHVPAGDGGRSREDQGRRYRRLGTRSGRVG